MADETTLSLLRRRTAKIVENYLKHHNVAVTELSKLISSIHQALTALGQPEESAQERPPAVPAVPIRRSIHRDYVVCLECGFRGKTIRRHLGMRHGLTRAQYRARWNLPPNHAIVAPSYSELRRAAAKQIGLGRRRRTSGQGSEEAPPSEPSLAQASVGTGLGLDPAFVASLGSVKRRRPRSTAPRQ
jgi:predicted transcriptional regulator